MKITYILTAALAIALTGEVSADQTLSTAQVARVTVDELSMRRAELESALPDFPRSSLARRTTGTATVEILVGRDGAVKTISITSAPDQAIADAVNKAVSQWRFLPVEVGHGAERHTVDTDVTLTFFFRTDAAGKGLVTRPLSDPEK